MRPAVHPSLVLLLAGLLVSILSVGALSVAAASGCLVPPVPGAIVEPFDAPECPWCPGRRGIVLAARPGQTVVAAADGEVTFAGRVVGILYLVVRHRDGVRATYGGLAEVGDRLDVGDRVRAGQPVATASDALYFGLRDDDEAETPLDPTHRLGSWRWRARLVPSGPTTPSGSRRPPPPRLVCGIAPERR